MICTYLYTYVHTHTYLRMYTPYINMHLFLKITHVHTCIDKELSVFKEGESFSTYLFVFAVEVFAEFRVGVVRGLYFKFQDGWKKRGGTGSVMFCLLMIQSFFMMSIKNT